MRTADSKTGIRGAKDSGRDANVRSAKHTLKYLEKGWSAMTKEIAGTNKSDISDDHALSDIEPGTANKPKGREEKSQLEGPAAYAPHDESEKSNR